MRGLGTSLCVRADVGGSDFLGHALFERGAGSHGGELGSSGSVGRLLADALAVLHEDELEDETGVRLTV